MLAGEVAPRSRMHNPSSAAKVRETAPIPLERRVSRRGALGGALWPDPVEDPRKIFMRCRRTPFRVRRLRRPPSVYLHAQNRAFTSFAPRQPAEKATDRTQTPRRQPVLPYLQLSPPAWALPSECRLRL